MTGLICPLAKVSIPSYPITGQLDATLEPVNRRQVKETTLRNHLTRQRLAEQNPGFLKEEGVLPASSLPACPAHFKPANPFVTWASSMTRASLSLATCPPQALPLEKPVDTGIWKRAHQQQEEAGRAESRSGPEEQGKSSKARLGVHGSLT